MASERQKMMQGGIRRRHGFVAILVLVFLLFAPLPPWNTLRVSAQPSSATASGDWPYFGRDRNDTFFSPLTQITAGNVQKLGVAWSQILGRYSVLSESYPQMIGRILYVTTATDEVLAYTATSGKLLWRYAPKVDFSLSTGVGGYGVSVNRGVAVDGDKVYLVTFDGQLHALSQATGEKLWQSTVADPRQGYYETMAPTVWNGMVFVGSSGSQDGVRGFVAAYDAATGKLVWRFYTVPAPGNGWVPKGRHGGGGTYMPPVIDTGTGIVYIGTGTPSPVLVGAGRLGTDLYTDSILALNAHTGKLVWYFQETPHDQWSYGAASPVTIFDTTIKGKKVHAVGEAGKNGYYYLLDARTGKKLFAPLAYVKVNNPGPPTTKGVVSCPGTIGGSPYSPSAYSPVTHAAYVSGINLCFKLTLTSAANVGGERDFAGSRSPVGKPTGTFSAVDVTTGRFLWKLNMPTPMIGGAAVTATNLVFTADQHGTLYAFDARTGKIIWKANAGLASGSAPIIYSIDGAEYVAYALGGSAVTGAQHLGKLGAAVLVLKIGGSPIKQLASPGTPNPA